MTNEELELLALAYKEQAEDEEFLKECELWDCAVGDGMSSYTTQVLIGVLVKPYSPPEVIIFYTTEEVNSYLSAERKKYEKSSSGEVGFRNEITEDIILYVYLEEIY